MVIHYELALPDIDDPALSAFAIARIAEPRMCPVLGAPLQGALSGLVDGMPVVIVHRDVDGDVRAYGHEAFATQLLRLDLDAQPWVVFELPHEDTAAPAPATLLAA